MTTTNYFTDKIEQWLRQRKGKITSSEYYKLTIGGKRPMTDDELAEEKAKKGRRTTVDTLFGDGALTYIRSRVTEMQSTETKIDVDYKQTEWGKDHEHEAVEQFERVTGLQVDYNGICSPVFYPYGDFAGGSPDGVIKKQSAGLELKCPYNEDIHTRRLLIKSIDQFKEEEWEAYCQCQFNMLILKTENWYYGSYDPRRENPQLRMKIIKLKPDQEWITDFHIRHNAAIEMMANVLYDTDKHLFVE